MTRDVLGTSNGLAKASAVVGALAVALSVLRLLDGIRSWGDVLVIPIGVGFGVSLLWLVGGAIDAAFRRRARILKVRFDAAHAWPVITRFATYFLLATEDRLYLVDRRARQLRSWPVDQVRSVRVERVPIGKPSRPGLRVEFGVHRTHESLVVACPRYGGFWSSDQVARSVKATIDSMRAA